MQEQSLSMQDGTQLDSKALKVMKAIRQVESGGKYNAVGDSGDAHGAFQFNEKTGPGWKNLAKQYLGDENAVMDKGNQNQVAYKRIKQWKDEGKEPEEIAALWNGASKGSDGKYTYNNPDYGVKFREALLGQSNQAAQKYPLQVSQQKPVEGSIQTADEPTEFQRKVQSLAQPFLKMGSNVRAAVDIAKADSPQEIEQAKTNDYTYGYFGKAKPLQGVKDAVLTGKNAGLEIASVMGITGLIKGVGQYLGRRGTALVTKEVGHVLSKYAGKDSIKALTSGEKLNALTEALSKAEPAIKPILKRAIQELGPKILKEARVGSFSELNPAIAKTLGLGAKAIKFIASQAGVGGAYWLGSRKN